MVFRAVNAAGVVRRVTCNETALTLQGPTCGFGTETAMLAICENCGKRPSQGLVCVEHTRLTQLGLHNSELGLHQLGLHNKVAAPECGERRQ